MGPFRDYSQKAGSVERLAAGHQKGVRRHLGRWAVKECRIVTLKGGENWRES